MRIISKKDAVQRIVSTKGRVFSARFIKRTTGEIRNMNCRLGVTKHLRGGELKYKPAEKNLVGVFDMKKGGYRTIDIDGLLEIRVDGEEFVVIREEESANDN